LDSFTALDHGTLRLGFFPTASASLLPLALARFGRRHTGIRIEARAGVLAELREMRHTGEVEQGLPWDYEWNRLDDPALSLTHLLDDPTVLVVPADSPLRSHPAVRLGDLADQEWIIRADNHPVADVLRRSCRQAGFEPRIAYSSHDYQEAQAMVAAGLGIALAPRLALTSRRSDVRLLPFASHVPAPTRRILLARATAAPPPRPPRRWPASCARWRSGSPPPARSGPSSVRYGAAEERSGPRPGRPVRRSRGRLPTA
jgi:DNA-binding transcriptional LysR family regulator